MLALKADTAACIEQRLMHYWLTFYCSPAMCSALAFVTSSCAAVRDMSMAAMRSSAV